MAAQNQINIRLHPESFEKLEAAAFVNRVTPSALLTEAAEEAIEGWGDEAPVKAALAARRAAESAQAEKLAPLRPPAGTARRSRRR